MACEIRVCGFHQVLRDNEEHDDDDDDDPGTRPRYIQRTPPPSFLG